MPKSKSEHTIAIIKAGLSAIPVVGGAVASLIGDYVPTSTQQSLERSVALLKKNVGDLQDRLDPGSVAVDEFSELFKGAYLELVRTHKEIKRQAAVGIIVNAMLKPNDSSKLTFDELDHFARSLEQLTAGALEVLGVVVDLSKSRGREARRRRLNFEEVDKAFPAWDSDLVMGLASELHGANLVHVSQVGSVRTDNYGNYPVEVTDLGVRFVDHVLRLAS